MGVRHGKAAFLVAVWLKVPNNRAGVDCGFGA